MKKLHINPAYEDGGVLRDEFVARRLVRRAQDIIRERYEAGRHHVAAVLLCDGRYYTSLHLDNPGFDICAEPSALAEAIFKKEDQFDMIVSAYWNGNDNVDPVIVSPCGNCRQLLCTYAPNLDVIVGVTCDKIDILKASELLPSCYAKPDI